MSSGISGYFAEGRAREAALLAIHLDQCDWLDISSLRALGDWVIQEVAGRVMKIAPRHARLTMTGRGKMLLLLPQTGREQALVFARVAAGIIRKPISANGQQIAVLANIGIALISPTTDLLDEAIACAESAAIQAQQGAVDHISFHCHAKSREAELEFLMAQDLRMAAARGQLALVYQPKFHNADGRLSGFEALLRWQHPRWNAIPVSRLISLAEKTGLIVEIGGWVVGQACKQISAWRESGLGLLPIAVNVSALQLQHQGFVQEVADALAKYALSPRWLELEVTESTAVCGKAWQTLRNLSAMGIHLSLDDFGSGYSSLSALRRLPVQRIKLDRSFIENIPVSRQDLQLLSMLVSAIHVRGMKVTVEGVESPCQLQSIRESGCDEIQGFLLARPMGVEAAGALLDDASHIRQKPSNWPFCV